METNGEAYARACWPGRWRILGRRLRPLTLGHALVLQQVGSPYAFGAEASAAGLGDWLLGLWICSRDWRAAARGLESRWRRARLHWWVWLVAFLVRGGLVWRLALWSSYLAEAYRAPRWWEQQGSAGSRSGRPVELSLKMTLMCEYGKSEGEALDTPFAQALWEYFGWAEREGAVALVSDGERALRGKAEGGKENHR